jgi:hypothetical protein
LHGGAPSKLAPVHPFDATFFNNTDLLIIDAHELERFQQHWRLSRVSNHDYIFVCNQAIQPVLVNDIKYDKQLWTSESMARAIRGAARCGY